MEMEMEIIKYNDKYKVSIIDLILTIQNKEAKINLSLEEQPDLLDIHSTYEKDGGEFWIALKNDEVIGTIALMIKENNCGILKKFFLKAKYRNKKIGLKLYLTLLEFSKSKKLKYIILDTPFVAVESHKLYERSRFVRVKSNELPIHYEYPDRNSYLYLLKM